MQKDGLYNCPKCDNSVFIIDREVSNQLAAINTALWWTGQTELKHQCYLKCKKCGWQLPEAVDYPKTVTFTFTITPKQSMKPFDVALQHLEEVFKTPVDMSLMLVPADQQINPELMEKLNLAGAEFIKQMPINLKSNEHYYGMVFNAAAYHSLYKSNNKESYFDVANKIINNRIQMDGATDDFYENTTYPKDLVEKFMDYCNSLTDCPVFLSEDGGFRASLFFVAYHHIIDEK